MVILVRSRWQVIIGWRLKIADFWDIYKGYKRGTLMLSILFVCFFLVLFSLFVFGVVSMKLSLFYLH